MTLTAAEKQAIAREHGLVNVGAIWRASAKANVPFYVACALMEKESGGRNVYGHDQGGALSGFLDDVDKSNYRVFEWLVFKKGYTSNGVGPAQITYRGFFTDMVNKGLRPWVPYDNILYGLMVLKSHYDLNHSWQDAGTKYNGALAYGVDFAAKVEKWKALIRPDER
jgi:hypothetical protein